MKFYSKEGGMTDFFALSFVTLNMSLFSFLL